MGRSRFCRQWGPGGELRGRREITMSGYAKRIECLPILVGFPARGALCDAARPRAGDPAALSSNDLEAALGGWLTGGGWTPGIPVSRDRTAVYICRALLAGEQYLSAGPEAGRFPNFPVEHSPFPCVECAGNLNPAEGCPHGQLTSSVELGCGQIAVPIVGALDLVR
jgi:hypothetical protein